MSDFEANFALIDVRDVCLEKVHAKVAASYLTTRVVIMIQRFLLTKPFV